MLELHHNHIIYKLRKRKFWKKFCFDELRHIYLMIICTESCCIGSNSFSVLYQRCKVSMVTGVNVSSVRWCSVCTFWDITGIFFLILKQNSPKREQGFSINIDCGTEGSHTHTHARAQSRIRLGVWIFWYLPLIQHPGLKYRVPWVS